jgi:sugar phosphate isomerase/epimerase
MIIENPDRNRLCVHTMTTRPMPLELAVREYADAGVAAISVWREHLEPSGAKVAASIIGDSGLAVASLCRGGFFASSSEADRKRALDHNRRAIDEAQAIGAPLVVLVCGAAANQPLETSRSQIAEGIAAVLPYAEAADVRLAIEPLHPMYADTRSAINTLGQANDMVDQLNSPNAGVAIDVYHTWWDPNLQSEIERAGDSIFAFHVCDWRVPTRDLLNDRALMGEGCIPIRQIRSWVDATGFGGFIEVELFSDDYWDEDQTVFLEQIVRAYSAHC